MARVPFPSPGPQKLGGRLLYRSLAWVLLGGLGLALAAQGLPALPAFPAIPPGTGEPGTWSLGELVPLRPKPNHLEISKDASAPVRMRGKNIQEGPEGWTLEEGALESPDLLLLADHIRYVNATGELEAEGHIRLEGPGIRLQCVQLRMNWKTRIGEAWALDLEIQPTWVLRSDKVAFNTMKHWDFDKVELSPCPQEKPGWKATASRLTVDLDRYATIHNLWIWIDAVPTYYYLPWAIYPANAERTSGVLPISLSPRGPMGASLAVPIYMTLGPSADTTLSTEYFSNEGVLVGNELRWNPEPTHRGSAQGEFIHQRSDGENRYRFTVKELWQREDGWQVSADLNGASDTLLDSDYGKGIGQLGSTPFDSALFVGKNFPWASINLTSSQQRSYFETQGQSYYLPNFPYSLTRTTLPTLQGRLYPVPVGSFYLDGGLQISRLAYGLDNAGASPNSEYGWGRQDLFARMQGSLGQWGPFKVDLQTGFRSTHYTSTLSSNAFALNSDPNGVTADGVPLTAQDPFSVTGPAATRTLGSARVLFSAPQVGRTFEDLHFLGYAGEIKHLVNPYFAFTETSVSGAQGYLPHFDEVDDAPGVNNSASGEQSVEVGLKQHFLGRSSEGGLFSDLIRWNVAARYHFRPILMDDGRYLKGWASLDNDINLEPSDQLRIALRRSSDVNNNSADTTLSVDYTAGEGTRYNFAYFSTGINRFLVPQKGLQVGGLQRLWDDRVRLELKANYDFQSRTFSSSQVGVAYMTPCVAYSLRFSHIALGAELARQSSVSASREDRLDFVVTLRTLGDVITQMIPF